MNLSVLILPVCCFLPLAFSNLLVNESISRNSIIDNGEPQAVASINSNVRVENDSSNKGEKSPDAQPKSDKEMDVFDYPSLFTGKTALLKLDKSAPIWVSKDRQNVVLGGEVCLREGLLEFFACRKNSKEHESIVSLDIPPHLIHAALLAIGAKQGTPAKFDPEFVSPTGEEIEINVCWRDEETGNVRKVRAQEFVLENESGKKMQAPWVFTGGLFGVDPNGKKYYLANVTGEVFGVSNFPGSVLDVPFESSNDNSQLNYAPNTKIIPSVGTKVVLVLSRKSSVDPKNGLE